MGVNWRKHRTHGAGQFILLSTLKAGVVCLRRINGIVKEPTLENIQEMAVTGFMIASAS
jgi:hypothetical protein